MRNDLLVFEFENSDGREVLLDPGKFAAVAQALRHLFELAVVHTPDATPNLSPTGREVHLYLAAIEAGCIRAGFRAVLGNLSEQDREDLQVASAVVTTIDTIVGWIFKAGIGAALLHPVLADEDRDTLVEIKVPAVLANNGWSDAIEDLVSQSLEAGADRVIISAPDMPRCQASVSKFRWDLLGSKAAPLPPHLLGDHEVLLRIIAAPRSFETPEGVKHLALGYLNWEGREPREGRTQRPLLVLVEWGSSQPLPRSNQEQTLVRGQLQSINFADYRALDELSAIDREVTGLFIVTGKQGFS